MPFVLFMYYCLRAYICCMYITPSKSLQDITNDEYFWCHEWEAHGTCALGVGKIQSEFDFFSTVLDLFENKLNYDKYVLAKQKILPSKTKYYWVRLRVTEHNNNVINVLCC